MTLGDFSQQADAYRRSRPTYPAALVDLLVDEAGVVAGDHVADFGAGTGIFTRLLVERGFRVTAVEPNEAMRRENDVPQAQWTSGAFEASGLDDASQRWAVAAQAFHWADPAKSLPEIRRVLERGGVFTILWNNRAGSESDILGWTEAAIRRRVPEFSEAYRQQRAWDKVLESTGDFTFLTHRMAMHVVPMTKARYVELWKSHNRLNVIAGPERFAALRSEIEEHLERQGVEPIDVTYRCEAWSARRID